MDSKATKSKGTVVFFSMDALGHIHPILSIAKELQRRGYRAIVLTTRPLSMAPQLREKGYELDCCQQMEASTKSLAKSEEVLRAMMEPLMNVYRRGLPESYEATYSLTGAADKHVDDMIENHEIIEAKLKSLRPDLIVFDHIIGVPCVTKVAPRWVRLYSGFPSTLFSSYNKNYVAGLGVKPQEVTAKLKDYERNAKGPLREKIRRFWAEKKGEDWPSDIDLSPTSPYLNFYLGPQELGLEKVPTLKPLPEDRWFRLEHTIEEPDGSSAKQEFELPENLANCPGKLIYFSLGTLVTSDTNLINRLLAILSKSPNKFIISKGELHQHIKTFPNMWGDKFVNQKAILPKVDLFITHGGHNSIIEAFYYGCPGLIVLPVFADQFDSGQRVEDCGLGIRLNPFNCTEQELLNSIDSMLANEQVAERMKSISSRLRSIKYHELAVDKLEQLIRR